MKRQGRLVRWGAERGFGFRLSGRSTAGTPWGAWLIVIYAAALGAAVWLGRLPLLALAVVAGLSVLTFVAYALDKSAAQAGRWRTQESTLHLLAFAGGWPGAWCAQRLLRHKSSKASFLWRFYLTVALHGAALGAWVFWLSKHAAFG